MRSNKRPFKINTQEKPHYHHPSLGLACTTQENFVASDRAEKRILHAKQILNVSAFKKRSILQHSMFSLLHDARLIPKYKIYSQQPIMCTLWVRIPISKYTKYITLKKPHFRPPFAEKKRTLIYHINLLRRCVSKFICVFANIRPTYP